MPKTYGKAGVVKPIYIKNHHQRNIGFSRGYLVFHTGRHTQFSYENFVRETFDFLQFKTFQHFFFFEAFEFPKKFPAFAI